MTLKSDNIDIIIPLQFGLKNKEIKNKEIKKRGVNSNSLLHSIHTRSAVQVIQFPNSGRKNIKKQEAFQNFFDHP